MSEQKRYLMAAQAYLEFSSQEELPGLFEKYPELLDKNIESAFLTLLESARKKNANNDTTSYIEQQYQLLRLICEELEPEIRLSITVNSADIHYKNYKETGNLDDLSAIINAWKIAVSQTQVDSSALLGRLNNLATNLGERYDRLGELGDLQDSISALRKAKHLSVLEYNYLPAILSNLGGSLSKLYAHSGSLADLQEAISVFRQAKDLSPANSPLLPIILNNLGTGLKSLYTHSGNLADLQSAVSLFQDAKKLISSESPELCNILNNLGNAFRERYLRLNDQDDLQNAIEHFQQAKNLTAPNSQNMPTRLNNLGAGLRARYTYLGDIADLHAAIELWQQAVAHTHSKSTDLPARLHNLGAGLRDRYQKNGDIEDLQGAIKAFQQATNLTAPDSPAQLSRLINLGAGIRDRYMRLGESADLENAKNIFRQAVQMGRKGSFEEWLISSRNWINWAFERKSWDEIEEAYPYAQEASTKLIKIQATRTEKEAWIRDMQGIAAKTAYAFAKLDKPEQAALALEQGSARLLSETLTLNHADIEALRDSPQPALYQAYTDALTAYQNAQHIQKPEIQQQALRDAWKNLEAVIAQIRQVEGFEQFLQPAGFEEIAQAAERPLLYLAVTAQGGVGILVQRENVESVHCSAFFLPQLDDTQLRERLIAYLNAYQQRHQDNMDREMWEARLQALCRWLGEVFLKPVRESLPNLKEITLIPLGLLNLLPLHAASDGQRSALDDLRIRYAPNARSLNRARAVRESAGSDKLFVACNPQQNLRYSELETAIAQGFIPKQWVLYRQDATIEAVKARLPQCNVLHFSCHGNTDTQNPLDSALLLADGKLTLDSLLKIHLNARLVILSACETGMLADLQRAEEFVSLSTGLLQAGSAAVIASLWSVRDDSTMILISFFYYLWRCKHLEPAEALRQAQIWLRDSTPQQRIAFFRELLPEAAVMELDMVLKQDFSHPYHWAGFGVVGV